jgi:hypothetical protein
MFKQTINDNLKFDLYWGAGCDPSLSRRSSFLTISVVSAVLALRLFATCQSEYRAQLSDATEVDIGNPGPAGSFTYSAGIPPQYPVNGAGGFGTLDTYRFAGVPGSSNFEIPFTDHCLHSLADKFWTPRADSAAQERQKCPIVPSTIRFDQGNGCGAVPSRRSLYHADSGHAGSQRDLLCAIGSTPRSIAARSGLSTIEKYNTNAMPLHSGERSCQV